MYATKWGFLLVASGTFSGGRAGMFWLFMLALLIWLVLILWECAVILNLAFDGL